MQKTKREARAKMELAFDAYDHKSRAVGDPSVTAQAVDEARQAASEAVQKVKHLENAMKWYKQVKAFLTDKNAKLHVMQDDSQLRMMGMQEEASKRQESLNAAFFDGMS